MPPPVVPAEIEAALKSLGRTRANAFNAEKQVTALAIRSVKHAAKGAALAQVLRERADGLGLTTMRAGASSRKPSSAPAQRGLG